MKPDERESAILERVQRELADEGYDVVVRPSRLMVPDFLGDFVPDALAFGKDRNLVVEVAAQAPKAERRVRELSERISRQPQWDLKLIWISASETPQTLRPVKGQDLREAIDEAENLVQSDHPRAALILAWATLEAIARRLMPQEAARPQAPAKLVERLAREGHITVSEAKTLRDLVSPRNRFIHGDLGAAVSRRAVGAMVQVIRELAVRNELGAGIRA